MSDLLPSISAQQALRTQVDADGADVFAPTSTRAGARAGAAKLGSSVARPKAERKREGRREGGKEGGSLRGHRQCQLPREAITISFPAFSVSLTETPSFCSLSYIFSSLCKLCSQDLPSLENIVQARRAMTMTGEPDNILVSSILPTPTRES